MLCFKTQSKLAQFLEVVVKQESQLEECKQILSEQNRFESYTIFKKLDRNQKGYLGLQEIQYYLQENRVDLTMEGYQSVFEYFDLNQDDRISYSEFLAQIVPKQNDSLTDEVHSRKPYRLTQQDQMPNEVEQCLSRVFEQINKKYKMIEEY